MIIAMSRPKTMDTRLTMSVTDKLLSEIDEWRRFQPDIPARAEAIRRLVEEGITAKRELELMAERLDIMRTIAISWAQDAGAADETVQMIATEDPLNLNNVDWLIAHRRSPPVRPASTTEKPHIPPIKSRRKLDLTKK